MFNSSETTPNVLNLAFYVLSGSAVMRTTTTADKNIGQRIFCTILLERVFILVVGYQSAAFLIMSAPSSSKYGAEIS